MIPSTTDDNRRDQLIKQRIKTQVEFAKNHVKEPTAEQLVATALVVVAIMAAFTFWSLVLAAAIPMTARLVIPREPAPPTGLPQPLKH